MRPIHTYIDYTLLRPGCTRSQIAELCQQALDQQYAAACIPPWYTGTAVSLLSGSAVNVCTVVGFPHGMHLTETKLAEATHLIAAGAQELDLVSNLAALRSREWQAIGREIRDFVRLCRAHRVTSKIIIESGSLDLGEVARICDICSEAEADFVKTSTGFAERGAEIGKVAEMRRLLPPEIRIKASGGIRDYDTARQFIEAGADRIGTSSLITET